jgi:hypothetical protein
LRPGRWPPQLPAYESAGDTDWSAPSLGTVSRWRDAASGFGVDIEWGSPGRLRCEGECRGDGPELRYRIRLDAGPSTRPPAAPPAMAECPVRTWSETRWGRHAHRRFSAGRGSELTVSGEVGLVEWKTDGWTVLKQGSGSRGFGAMAVVPSALWPSLNADRSDVDRGPEWAGVDGRFVFREAGAPVDPATAYWTIGVSDDLASLVLTTDVPAAYAGLEAVLNLKPAAEVTALEMADTAGRLHKVTCLDEGVDRPWGLWWGFTRRAVVPVGGGRRLEICPLAADHGEILVRSVTAGFLISLFSRVGAEGRSEARWGLRVLGNGTPVEGTPVSD